VTFAPTAGSFGEIQESAERQMPSLQLILQNADGVLGPLCHPDAGGEDLRVFPAESIRVPDRTCQGLRCRWLYKGAHCGYVGDLATCDKTVEDCRRHFDGEPLRFGGFPTSADARALRVD